MWPIVFVYALMEAVSLAGTVAAPSVQRHLADGDADSVPASAILVAASPDSGSSRDGYHGNSDDAERDCGSELQLEMNDCLEDFEVQLVVFEDPELTDDQRWRELRELCRLHDQTLQCIYMAFMRCQPTEAELQLMAYRIGHLRDFMLRECRVARARTTISTVGPTTSTVGVTSTRHGVATGATRAPQPARVLNQPPEPDADRNKVRMSHRPVYVIDGNGQSSSRADERFRVVDAIRFNELGNDTHSRLREPDQSEDDPKLVILCQTTDGKSRTECLLEAFSGTSPIRRPVIPRFLFCFASVIFCRVVSAQLFSW